MANPNHQLQIAGEVLTNYVHLVLRLSDRLSGLAVRTCRGVSWGGYRRRAGAAVIPWRLPPRDRKAHRMPPKTVDSTFGVAGAMG